MLVNLLGGLTGVIQSRALGPEQRGLLATAVVWPNVIGLLLTFQSPSAATYFVARERHRRAEYGCTAIALAGTVGAAVALVGAAGAVIVGGPARWPLVVMFVSFLPNVLAGVGIGALLGIEDYRGWSRMRTFGSVATLAGVATIVLLGWRTALVVSIVLALNQTLQLAVVSIALRRRQLLAQPRRALVRPIFAYAWRNAANVGWLVTYQLDQLVLSVAVAPAQLGLYAVAASFSAVIVPVAASTGTVMLARVSARGSAEVRASVRVALMLCALVAGGVCLVLAPTARPVVRLLFGRRFVGAVTPLRILLPGVVALALSSVLSDTLRGLGRPLTAARAEVIGAVSTVILLVALIPPLGIRGAAIASTVSYAAVAATMGWGLRQQMARDRG